MTTIKSQDLTDPQKIKEAAALLYMALMHDHPAVIAAVDEHNPIRFGLTLKTIVKA